MTKLAETQHGPGDGGNEPHGNGQFDAGFSLDQLEYMLDLIGELREMATTARLQTLAAILGLAATEANQRIDARRGR